MSGLGPVFISCELCSFLEPLQQPRVFQALICCLDLSWAFEDDLSASNKWKTGAERSEVHDRGEEGASGPSFLGQDRTKAVHSLCLGWGPFLTDGDPPGSCSPGNSETFLLSQLRFFVLLKPLTPGLHDPQPGNQEATVVPNDCMGKRRYPESGSLSSKTNANSTPTFPSKPASYWSRRCQSQRLGL